MKRAQVLGLLVAAGCASSAPPGRSAPAPAPATEGPDLVAVARALTAIDVAEMRGEIAAERQRRGAASRGNPSDAVARFLALCALPRNEETWGAFRGLAEWNPPS